VKVNGRAEINCTKMTFLGNGKNSFDKKISLKVSDLWVNPACLVGVLVSRPNFKAR
jgi:hypothetical protein